MNGGLPGVEKKVGWSKYVSEISIQYVDSHWNWVREAKSKLRVKIGFVTSVCWCLVVGSAFKEHKIS